MLAKLPNMFVVNKILYTNVGRKVRVDKDKATKYFLSMSSPMDLICEILNICSNAVATIRDAYSVQFQTAPVVVYVSVEFDDKTIKNKINTLQNMHYVDDNGYVLLSEYCFGVLDDVKVEQITESPNKKNWRDMWYERYDKD